MGVKYLLSSESVVNIINLFYIPNYSFPLEDPDRVLR
jgi:hypothetical protein